MKIFRWVVRKMYAIKEKDKTKKSSIFFRSRLKLDNNSSIGEQSILGRKDYTARKIDGNGEKGSKETK